MELPVADNLDFKKIPRKTLQNYSHPKSPHLAAGISLLWAGGGHFYIGEWKRGLFFSAVELVSLVNGVSAILLTLMFWAVLDAWQGTNDFNRRADKFRRYLREEHKLVLD